MRHATLDPAAAKIEPRSSSTIFEFDHYGQPVRFSFGDATTYIPGRIMALRSFYEEPMLADMRDHLARYAPGRDRCVIDAGANIGNHTLYLALIAGARVLAIEPADCVARDLEATCRLNGVADRVTCVRAALGERPGHAVIEHPQPGEPGTARVRSADGAARAALKVVTIDSLDLPAPPAILKIDVEGSELAVLSGARRTLDAHRPVIYAECHGRAQFEAVRDYLADPDLGAYTPVARFNDDPTYKFMPTRTDEERSRALVALGALVWSGKFQRVGDLDTSKSRHDALLAAVADLTARVNRLQAEQARQTRDGAR